MKGEGLMVTLERLTLTRVLACSAKNCVANRGLSYGEFECNLRDMEVDARGFCKQYMSRKVKI